MTILQAGEVTINFALVEEVEHREDTEAMPERYILRYASGFVRVIDKADEVAQFGHQLLELQVRADAERGKELARQVTMQNKGK